MDDDEYHEGWQLNVIYRPCPYNPLRCRSCHGSGDAPEWHDSDDCPECNGSGWKDSKPRWPIAAEDIAQQESDNAEGE